MVLFCCGLKYKHSDMYMQKCLMNPTLIYTTQVLSVGKALSIQAHPDLPHAQQLHKERPEVIKAIFCLSNNLVFMSPGIQRSKPQTRDRHCPYWLWRFVWVQAASRNPGVHCQVGYDVPPISWVKTHDDLLMPRICYPGHEYPQRAGIRSCPRRLWESLGERIWKQLQVHIWVDLHKNTTHYEP